MPNPTDAQARQLLARHLDTPGVDPRIIALSAEFDLDPNQVVRVLRGGLEHDAAGVAELLNRDVGHIKRLAVALDVGRLVAPRKRRFSARDVERLEEHMRANPPKRPF